MTAPATNAADEIAANMLHPNQFFIGDFDFIFQPHFAF
jgi:hypothetical protein